MKAVSPRIAVMEGRLSDVDLAEVLQVVSLGRQYTGIELREPDRSPAGTIFVKGGKVVSATARGARGREAFLNLLREGPAFFHVFRTETPRILPEPLGPIHTLLMEALGANPKAPKAQGVQPPVTSNAANSWDEEATRPSQPPPPPYELPPPPSMRSGAPGAQGNSTRAPSRPPPAAGTKPSSTGAMRSPSQRTSKAPPQQEHGGTAVASATRAGSASPRAVAGAAKSAAAERGGAAAGAESPAAVGRTAESSNRAQASSGRTAESSNRAQASSERRARSTLPPASRAAGDDRQPVVLAVASPKGGCGKTTVALNLALSLARRNHSVVLVDGDLNGDVLSAIDARGRAGAGVFDVLAGHADLDDTLLSTIYPHFHLIAAAGKKLPGPEVMLVDHRRSWQQLLGRLAGRSDVVVVDTPAGMYGVTHQILSAATHVIGVLQAETLARRSFARFSQGIEALPPTRRPEVVGVFLNMLQPGHEASVSVLAAACQQLPDNWLFETAIPRSAAFLEASAQGLPLRLLDEDNPPPVTWLFETLASEVVERLKLVSRQRKPRPLLV